MPFYFLSSSLLSFKELFVFALDSANSFMIGSPNSTFINAIHFFNKWSVKFKIWSARSYFISFCNAFVNIFCLYGNNEAVCIHITKFCISPYFGFHKHININALKIYSDLTLINLNTQGYSLEFEFL